MIIATCTAIQWLSCPQQQLAWFSLRALGLLQHLGQAVGVYVSGDQRATAERLFPLGVAPARHRAGGAG